MLRATRRAVGPLLVLVAQVVGSVAAVPDAIAQTPIWVQLPPPASVGLHVRDSRRDREIFFDESGLFAIPDAPNTTWERLTVDGSPAAAGRDFAFYDHARDRIWTVTSAYSDTLQLWFMDLSSAPLSWTRQNHTFASPGPGDTVTYDRAFVFDPVRDRLIAYGGYFHTCGICPVFSTDAVHSLSLGGTPQWARETVSGPGPGARTRSAMVFDPWRDRVVLFGGLVQSDETWALSLEAPMTWSMLNPSQLPPSARMPAAAALDSLGRRWFIMGGLLPMGGGVGGETWWLDLGPAVPANVASWTKVAGTPPLRAGALFEQQGQSRMLSWDGAELWSMPLSQNPAWALVGDGSQGLVARQGHVAFLDVAHQRIIAGLGPDNSFQSRPIDADVPWTTLPEHGPSQRYGAVAVVDAIGGRALVFGGSELRFQEQDSDEYSDLWSLDLDSGAWTQITPVPSPFIRTEALGVFDTARRRLIVHGGRYTNPGATALSDTWFFDAVGGTWSQASSGTYGSWWGEVGIYDPVRDRVVAFGGTNQQGGAMTDVHVLPLGVTPGSWSLLPTSGTPPFWNNLLNSVDVLAAAYDPNGDRMIVMAGTGPRSAVWELTLGASPTWTRLDPAGVLPAQRTGPAFVSDPVRQRMLMVGGSPMDFSITNVLGDCWALYLDQTTPTQLGLVSADATGDEVTLRWYVSGSAPVSATVYRRAPEEDWRPLGQQAQDGTGFISWVDRDILAGASYEYRLGLLEPGGERFYGHTSIQVPLQGTLALAGVHPNPSDGELLVTFSLASGAPAVLELFDVSGRRVAGRAVGSLGTGTHVLRMDPAAGRLSAGLYYLRLVQGDLARTARVVVAR